MCDGVHVVLALICNELSSILCQSVTGQACATVSKLIWHQYAMS